MVKSLKIVCVAIVLWGTLPCAIWSQTNQNSTTNRNSSRQSTRSSSTGNSSTGNRSTSSRSTSTADRTKARQDAAKKRADEKAKKEADKKRADAAKKKPGGNSNQKSTSPGAPGSSTSPGLAAFTMKANDAVNILSVELASAQPTLNILVRKNEVFPTRVVFKSGGMEEFDTIDVSVKYDPRILVPQGIDDSAFSSRLSEPALARVDRKKGIIAWHGKLAQPTVVNTSEIFRIAWKPIALSDLTKISFFNNADYPSRVMRGHRNLLLPVTPEGAELGSDNAMDGSLGLLGADVTVVTDLVTDEMADGTSGTSIVTMVGSSTMKLARDIVNGEAVGNIQLRLTAQSANQVVGRDFIVLVGYSNPNMVSFDRVRLTINFDPKVLQVVDWDDRSWISDGVNINDGDFHEALPFDVHLKNQALNNMGRIFYEMAFTHNQIPAENGIIAKIRFRPIKQTAFTQISFEQIDDESHYLASPTSLSFLGYNLIGIPGRRGTSYGLLNLNITEGQ